MAATGGEGVLRSEGVPAAAQQLVAAMQCGDVTKDDLCAHLQVCARCSHAQSESVTLELITDLQEGRLRGKRVARAASPRVRHGYFACHELLLACISSAVHGFLRAIHSRLSPAVLSSMVEGLLHARIRASEVAECQEAMQQQRSRQRKYQRELVEDDDHHVAMQDEVPYPVNLR
jgi:hypothetical protein